MTPPTYTHMITLPEALYGPMTAFLKANPEWDSDRLLTAALAHFLVSQEQPGEQARAYRGAARVYLDALFRDRLA